MDLHVYRSVEDRWSDLRGAARDHGAVLGTNTFTLDEVVERLTPDLESATPAQRLALVERAMRAAPDRWKVAGLGQALDALSALKAAGAHGFELRELDAGSSLADLLDRYTESLSAAQLTDPKDRCWIAAQRIVGGSDWVRHFDRIVVHAIYDLADCEFALIHNLIAALPEGGTVLLFNTTANVKPTQFAEWTWKRFLEDESLADKTFPEFFRPGGPNRDLLERLFVWEDEGDSSRSGPARSGLRILESRGRYAEIEAIGAEIQDLLGRGAQADEIAMVVRHIDAYGEIIDDVFGRYGIPVGFETGVPLIRVPFIKYWIALLDLVSSERPRHALARALASAYREPRLSPEFDVEGMLLHIGYIDRRHLAASALAARHNSPLVPELARFEALLDGFETAVRPPEAFMNDLAPGPSLTSRDRQAWEILAEEIRAISRITGPMAFAGFRRIVSETAGLRTISRFSSHSAPPGVPRVAVLRPAALGRRSFSWVFAPGFADGEIPSRVSATALLPDDLAESLNRKLRPRRLRTLRDRNRAEPLYLFMILDAASRQATLSFPSSTLEGETIYPSIYIAELLRHFDTSLVETPRKRPPREIGERMRAAAAAWRDELLDDEQARALLGDDVIRRAGVERRGSGRAAVGAGIFNDEDVWSPSALNALVQCPFIYMARHRLKLKEAETPDFDIPPMEVGTLAHRILREFYSQPIPESEEEAATRMDDIVRRHLSPIDIEGRGPRMAIDPALWKIRRPQLVRALMTWAAFAVRDAKDGYETLPQYLDSPLPPAPMGGITLGGRPDHVAIRRVNGELNGIRIDDFKYSALSGYTAKQLEQSFQIPVYAFLAARALNAERGVAMEGRYLLLRSPSSPISNRAVDENVFEETSTRIEQLAETVRKGALAPNPSDTQECGACSYRRLCRLYGS
ncbi:MAG TPA: PD-(D/E)XK nuclease family protein [Terriglobia bacterium]|nr:PD-(D/E)XK nuclease family protein [Terriglobia bacterium]